MTEVQSRAARLADEWLGRFARAATSSRSRLAGGHSDQAHLSTASQEAHRRMTWLPQCERALNGEAKTYPLGERPWLRGGHPSQLPLPQ